MQRKPPLLHIQDLTVAYRSGDGWLEAVREFALAIAPGQTYGLVGESGSGKSTIALTIMRYLPNGRTQQGAIWYNGRDLLTLSSDQMVSVWGREISLVPQDPLSALNPAIPIGEQIAETLRHHLRLDKTAAVQRAIELLDMVRIPDPPRVAASYPHQLSGGMQQRVMIALALGAEPPLLILDEPTTNLDVTTQAAVLDLLRDLITARQTAVLYVTHNLGVVAQFCDRVAVLYAGELVEDAPTQALYRQPLHPYTQGLLDSVPQLGQHKTDDQLAAIPGQIPVPGQRPSGCVFAPRCPLVIERCHRERPSLSNVGDGRTTRCHLWPEILAGNEQKGEERRKRSTGGRETEGDRLLQVDELRVYFEQGRSLGQFVTGRAAPPVRAVDGISLQAGRRQTVGIVGESGSGKTTLARAIIGLVERSAGDVKLLGLSLPPRLSQRHKNVLRQLQYIFQNPEEALNPYLTVGETLRRPFITLAGQTRAAAAANARRLLHAVKLSTDYANKFPGQLSGGEKQRIAIARAFATNPDLLIADEAVSALDVSVQAQILTLIKDIQQRLGLAILFVTHDLRVAAQICDKIAVMQRGRIVESGPTAALFAAPQHDYTRQLLAAVPGGKWFAR
ncbi:MAG: ABC transporter ATP-binding protein [Anaerolinea sp.]|nr:ABC transporter ATP-binding protein [Anaerolinea sp.]